jgi:predicted deacylase
MHTQTHPLVSPALGTARQLLSLHFGPETGQKVYIQASLHADELPGMLAAWHLRRRLVELEAAGRLRGRIVLVPLANLIGLNQQWLGRMVGRFDANTAQNFNRNFHDLGDLIMPGIEAELTQDAEQNRSVIRAAIRRALDALSPRTELESQRLALQRLSYDADLVLDLHCDWEAVMHLYTNPDRWDEVEPLARYLQARASLLALNSVGNPFDEIHSFCWSELREQFKGRYPIPHSAISVTVECRGQADVTHAYARQDAEAIIHFLQHRGIIDGAAPALPELPYPPTPLAGSEPITARSSGILVFHAAPGDWIEAGDTIAEVIDPLTDTVAVLAASTSGVLYSRHVARFATTGMVVANVAGAAPFRSGSLLSA